MNRIPSVRFVRINHLSSHGATIGSFVDPEWVFHYIASGHWTFLLQNQRYTVHPGQLVLLPPGLLHIVQAAGADGGEHWVAHFTSPGAETFLAGAPFVIAPPRPLRGVFRNRMVTMLAEFRTGAEHSDLRLGALMLELLSLYLRSAGAALAGTPADRPLWPQIERALDHIHAHIAETDLTIPALARTAGLSVPHFRRVFRACTGLTPKGYLVGERLNRAQAALLDGHLNCTQIAENCGFSSVHVFSRVFRRVHGLSPRQWLRRTTGETRASASEQRRS